ncbi:DEAD/DEAH box helicase [Empedobacter sp. UBA6322]|uniref:DEAD/DEAH box helicase n=1 Tax=Empedobacter sp. UBA6322 TaxID=1946446 RepID=UPI0025BAEFA9|nr:DEAD/DEAH box helicase [Empedobacter sp. UBA6322]
MEVPEITLKEFRKHQNSTFFNNAYIKLQLGRDLSEEEIINLLSTAVIFSNWGDIDLQKLGYKIIVSYSNKYSDYKPLYDFAINKGYIPISKFIETHHSNNKEFEEHFFGLFFSSFKENFREKNYYVSNGQKKLIEFSSNNDSNLVVVAPTSYGKSEIIINKVYTNLDKKICIIVPSKALLSQTKRRLLENSIDNKLSRIITHPEMYKGNEEVFVSVLTQERLLRLLQKNESLKFDLVLIDEAHNLLGDNKNDGRSILLAQTIIILKARNENVIFNFFSPFISDPENLKVKQSNYEILSKGTNEFIKSEKYFICDISKLGNLFLYDQFSNLLLDTNKKFNNTIEILKHEKSSKNIVYLNRPKHIEEFSQKLRDELPIIGDDIDELTNAISDFLHPEYNLIKCIRKGIVYHHGGMPEIVRLYVEYIFSKYECLNFVITSSTLLEGVNIPAEKIFLLSTKKGLSNLSISQFKNLIGRVNRFSEIFNNEKGNLELLEPHIYVIKSEYENKKANIETFIKTRAKTELKIVDEVNNLLLKNENQLNETDIIELNKSLEYLENIEPYSTNLKGVNYVASTIAKLCYKNNINDFEIKDNETILNKNLTNYKKQLFSTIKDSNELLYAIYYIFLKNVEILNNNLKRLQNSSAINFYSMILEWRSSSATYKEMIGSFMKYWKSLTGNNRIVFIGEKWGEEKRNLNDFKNLYVDLRKKSDSQMVNLAILKIKEEQDFVEFNLIKYIEILNELNLVDKDFYDRIKYGTSDKSLITLLKNGFSLELAKCITKENYKTFIQIKIDTEEIIIKSELIEEMKLNAENRILIFEIKFHINQR